MYGKGRVQRHRPDANAVCILDHHTPFIGVQLMLARQLLSDVRSLDQGCGVIGEIHALRVPNARSIFKMKEISHPAGLRLHWPPV